MSEPTLSSWIGPLRDISEPFISFWIGAIVAVLVIFGWWRITRARPDSHPEKLLDTSMPTVMTDIGADMDQLHSQIAVATRRLEMSVEQMKLRTSSQLSEIGRTSEAIGRLKGELAERTVVFAELQGKERAVSAQILSTETQLTAKSKELSEVERVLAERKTELARCMATFDVHPEIGNLRQIHAVEIDNLKAEKSQVEEQLRQSREECLKLQCAMNAIENQVEKTWASERMANAVLRERINDVASEVVRVATALEGLHSPIEAMLSAKLPTETVRAEAPAGNGHVGNRHAGNGHAVNGHAVTSHSGFGDALESPFENGDGSKTALVQRINALRKRTGELSTPG
jgi:hypothetical protein